MQEPLTRIEHYLRRFNVLFLSIISIEWIQIFSLILSNRLVLHDTFTRFSLQYFFLNNAVMSGEIPQWIPQLTQGTTAFCFYAVQGVNNLLTNVLFLFVPAIRQCNFLPIFYFSMFFDKLLLILGVWLLCRRYFSSSLTAFFVTASVSASSLWTSQSFFNFHLFYALPLIIELFHEFLDRRQWRYFCLGFNLFIMQIFGNAGYFIPVASFTLFLYFLLYAIFNLKDMRQALTEIRWGRPFILTLALTALFSFFIYFFLKIGISDPLVLNSPGRGAGAVVDLNTYLFYGRGREGIFYWLDLILGLAPAKDYTLYAGLFMVPMIVLALSRPNKRSLPMIILTTILALLSSATLISVFLYHFWPLMKLYRHLFLLLPLVRVWLCFLGGFGFEIFLRSAQNNSERQRTLQGAALFFLVLGGMLFAVSANSQAVVSLVKLMGLLEALPHSGILIFFAQVIRAASMKSFVFAVLVFFISRRYWSKKYGLMLVLSILFVHAWDVYSYAFREDTKRTLAMTKEQDQVHTFQSMPFSKRRNMMPWDQHPRAKALREELLEKTDLNWTIDAYLFNEQPGTSLRTDHYQSPLYDFMRAYDRPFLSQDRSLIFPLDHPSARKFSGVEEDKIQFFSRAYALEDKNSLAAIMRHPKYNGDLLFLSGVLPTDFFAPPWSGQVPLSENQRLGLPYEVLRFSANHLEMRVTLPGTGPAWLFYNDVWHPWWKAAVNGKSSKIFKANLAYKAVAIQPGVNRVHFSFGSIPLTVLLHFLCLNSLFWVLWIARKTYKCLVPPQPR